MPWTSNPDTPPTVRIAAAESSLQPTERRVADAILADREATVEMTAQQLADAVGVSRASVVRTAQTLGYSGFPQLRVSLAQEIASRTPEQPHTVDDPGSPMSGAVRRRVRHFAERLEQSVAALAEDALRETITSLDAADRVLVVANGFSAPLGLDMAQRLISAGRSAEFHTDAMTQRIAARGLGPQSVCLVYSGSGATKATLDAVEQAHLGGARVIAVTSFSRSALADTADVLLLVPPTNASFQDELIHTSRAALMLLTEQIIEIFVEYRAIEARTRGRRCCRCSATRCRSSRRQPVPPERVYRLSS